ncbi:MAG: M48 family metallopeptidase [Proteobacteria bacterium]|nr:M48 family metallopeptidase [Pseudomonadota bacterium]
MTFRLSLRAAILAAFALLMVAATAPAFAQPAAAPTSQVSVAPLPPPATANKAAPAFNVEKATNAYLSRISGEARTRSDSYFEGGYVLLFVDALYAIAVSALLLWSRFSAGIRNFAQRRTRSRFWQVSIYVAIYFVAVTVLTFPLTLYESFFREHAYGLSNQDFIQWFGDFIKGEGIGLVAMVIAVTVIYAVIRATPRYWWAWGTVVMVLFMTIGAVIEPVFIAPVFNSYKPLAESPLKDKILSIARSEGIPATNVYEFDASRQTKRISANVSGFLGTTRISLNDNLLNRSKDQREIIAVLGHEMGHYVLDHTVRLLLMMGLVFLVGFAFVAWGFRVLSLIFGGNWDVRTVDDPAGLPVLMALMTFFFLLATPVQNTIVRTTEAQADIFGVNAVREPDAFAEATLQLSEYRKLDPSPLEEALFYDHPSGRSRIHMMMQWKAEHLNDPDIKAGPVSPQ